MYEDIEANVRHNSRRVRTGKKPLTPEQMQAHSADEHKRIRLWFSKQKPQPSDGPINVAVTRHLLKRGVRRASDKLMGRKAGGYAKD